jgi:hypothetical protein
MARQKRRIPTLKAAIDWIALNDEPRESDIETAAMLISVVLVADLWQRQPEEIARKVALPAIAPMPAQEPIQYGRHPSDRLAPHWCHPWVAFSARSQNKAVAHFARSSRRDQVANAGTRSTRELRTRVPACILGAWKGRRSLQQTAECGGWAAPRALLEPL